MRDPEDVVIQPHISERAMQDIEEENWYTFKVIMNANKPEIKRAIEELFEVKVNKVTTCRMPSKNGEWAFMKELDRNGKKQGLN